MKETCSGYVHPPASVAQLSAQNSLFSGSHIVESSYPQTYRFILLLKSTAFSFGNYSSSPSDLALTLGLLLWKHSGCSGVTLISKAAWHIGLMRGVTTPSTEVSCCYKDAASSVSWKLDFKANVLIPSFPQI